MTEHAKTLHVAEAGAGTRDGARADVARRTRAELEAYGLSQSAAAHEIGFSPAVLGRWLADKYTGDVTGVTEKVARWLGTRAEARALTLTPVGLDAHAALAVTDRVMAALAHAQATEPPRVYRRLFCSRLRRLYQGCSGLHRMRPPVLVAAGARSRRAAACCCTS